MNPNKIIHLNQTFLMERFRHFFHNLSFPFYLECHFMQNNTDNSNSVVFVDVSPKTYNIICLTYIEILQKLYIEKSNVEA